MHSTKEVEQVGFNLGDKGRLHSMKEIREGFNQLKKIREGFIQVNKLNMLCCV